MAPIRTLVVFPLAAAISGCGFVDADPNRFEHWAEGVAAIELSAEDAGLRGPMITAQAAGLRGPVDPADRSPMRIEVVEPEVLWDARADGFQQGLRGPMRAATTAVAEAVVQQAVDRAPEIVPVVVEDVVRAASQTVQLGAFSSRETAEAAWARLAGHSALSGVTPRYETVERDGRTLVRLRAVVAENAVAAVCRAAGAGAFCASTGQS